MPDSSSLLLVAATSHLPLLTTIAAAFAAAWVLGLVTHRLGLSPIVGYLLAGVVIGPHTPGYIGDPLIAQQLAEVGVILLMFGVGLHFHPKDLLAVRHIAVPGALGQSLVATVVTIGIFSILGWSIRSTFVLGMAMSVASTVVLLRVLMDRGILNTIHGHVAVGWLIVEDILTVLALVLVPILGGAAVEGAKAPGMASVGWALLKLAALVVIVLLAGSRVVPWILLQVAKLRSGELFTLTVLVLSVTIAVASASLFGASVALGAFLAGMVVGQSPVSHQAAADALPMRDAFAVLFFVSVGMLFDPDFLVQHPLLVVAGLVIVLVIKPAIALVLVAIVGYPVRTALTVAVGLAQIGEFSFILAQLAMDHGLLSDEAMNVLVATAMISIALNPLAFRTVDRIERLLQRWPVVWNLLSARAQRRAGEINAAAAAATEARDEKPLSIIVGYGPVGRVVDALLRDAGISTLIIDTNIETIQALTRAGRLAMYGDATRREVLDQAGIRRAAQLIVTLPHTNDRAPLVFAARELNPSIEIIVRARYLAEHEPLRRAGADTIVFEEGEAGIALARHVLERRAVDPATIDKLLRAIREVWGMQPANPPSRPVLGGPPGEPQEPMKT